MSDEPKMPRETPFMGEYDITGAAVIPSDYTKQRTAAITPEQFRQMLPRSPMAATKLLGVSPEQIRKWSCGEEEIPSFAVALLQTVRGPAMGEYDVTGMAVIPPGYPGN